MIIRAMNNFLMNDFEGRKGRNWINRNVRSKYCIQEVICCLWSGFFRTNIGCMKFHPVCELCASPLLDFDCWHLPTWNPIQAVSCAHPLCLILIADVACMKFHPGCELCAPPLLYFDCWYCLHEIPSRVWVVCLLCLIVITDIAYMKYHPGCVLFAPLLYFDCWHCLHEIPGCELCAPPLLYFDCWHCLHEISSRVWVVCTSSALCWLLMLLAWNPIQFVSCVHILCFILIADFAYMKSHPDCELCASPLLYFDCWHCLHWNPIQAVSCVHLLCFNLIADIACMKSHPGCESCASPLLYFDCWCCLHEIPSSLWVVWTSSALFWWLTLPAWNSIQFVSCVHHLCLIFIADIACMKFHPFHPVCELCASSMLDFDRWRCLYEFPSRVWVVCISSALFWLLMLSAWNPI